MTNALAGAGGVGAFETGGAGGGIGQAGSSPSMGGGTVGTAGTSPGQSGGNGSPPGTTRAGTGGGGGASGSDGAHVYVGGNGGNGGDAGTAGTSSVGGGAGGAGGDGDDLQPQYAGFQNLSVHFQGGNGGNGGAGGAGTNGSAAGGGGGGNGGAGFVLTKAGTFLDLFGGVILGGNGGAGGAGSSAADARSGGDGGDGGNGGAGVVAGDQGLIINQGVIRGGAGGAGGAVSGTRAKAGLTGAYGAGLIGSNLSVQNGGTIAGGGDQGGAPHADAIDFTGGHNTLTLAYETVGTLNGNIEIAGTLEVQAGSPSASLSGGSLVFDGFGTAVTIDSGVNLVDTIAGFVASDTLDFAAIAYASKLATVFTASATGGALAIVDTAHGNRVIQYLTMAGVYTSGLFTLTADSVGGTTIGFVTTPPLGLAPGDVVTGSVPGAPSLAVVDRYNADYSLNQEVTVSKQSGGNYLYHYAGGSFFTGKSFAAFDNIVTAAGIVTSQTLYNAAGMATQQTQFNAAGMVIQQTQFNADGSVYLMDTISKLANGNLDYHYAGGTFFDGKSFVSFDNVTTASGVLVSQTLYDGSGKPTEQTQFNANGSIYLQDTVTTNASNQTLYHFSTGSFFDAKAYSAFDNLATANGVLLDQELYNKDGSHSFIVPGSGLTIAAAKNDAFSLSGSNDTIRFGASGFGADTVSGYTAGDVFSFSTSIFANYTTLSQHVSGTTSAIITDAANDTLTLNGVAKSSLTSGMFAFS